MSIFTTQGQQQPVATINIKEYWCDSCCTVHSMCKLFFLTFTNKKVSRELIY